MAQPPTASPWWKKLAWLLLIWAGGVALLGTIAWLLRWLMQAAGLATA